MRKILGGIVLVAGVGGLGWYGASHNAKAMQLAVTDAAQEAAQGTIHPLTTQVSGRDVTVLGVANSTQEQAEILMSMNDIKGRRVVYNGLRVLDTASPFALNATKNSEGYAYSGVIPTEAARSELASHIGQADADKLDLMAGAPDASWTGVVTKGLDSLEVLESGSLKVEDNTVTLTGTALTPTEDAATRAALAGLPDGYEAAFDIELLDDGLPFSLEMMNDGTLKSARGKFPAEVAASDVIGDVAADGIENAVLGDENGEFGNVAVKGVQALSQLENGTLSVLDTDVRLSGMARTPLEAEAAMSLLNNLPAGYQASFELATRDDGLPPSFKVTYLAAEGASAEGKLPADIELNDLANALDLSGVTGTPVLGLISETTSTTDQLNAVANWLPELDALTFSKAAEVVSIEAIASPGVNVELVKAGLVEGLGDKAMVNVLASTNVPDEGAVRVNQATDKSEAFTAGYWLPVYDFTSDIETCRAQSISALQADSVSFVTGSATLSAQSVRAINSVASIIRKCIAETDLNVEVGGHTDSQGGEDLNRDLSQARADVVRTALIARGVLEDAISANGYGESQPIADNATEEGRKENRRTTLTWRAPIVEPLEAEENTNAVTTDTNTELGE